MKKPSLLMFVATVALSPLTGCQSLCGDDACDFTADEWKRVQALSPLPEPTLDPTNRFDGVAGAIALGKALFFESRYSNALKFESSLGKAGEKGKVSCTACHDPDGAFQDTRSAGNLSLGVSWTTRNTPSLVNTVYYENHGWDLQQDTLWNQATTTPETGTYSDGDRCEYARMLWTRYRESYDSVFAPLPATLDPMHPAALPTSCKPKANAMEADGPWELMSAENKDVISRIMSNQGKAVAAYEARLISRNAPFDQYVAGDGGAITYEARQGLRLFIGKAACNDCHSGPFFTDQKAHNLGLTQEGDNLPAMDQGLHAGITMLKNNPFNSAGKYSDNVTFGQTRLANIKEPDDSDRGRFRTQTLRNVAQTGPYMHTGNLATLRDVVDYYNKGGESEVPVGQKDAKIRPLALNEREVSALVAFLGTLTGEPVDPSLRMPPPPPYGD